MKTNKIILTAFIAIIIAACNTSKKSSGSSASTTPATNNTTTTKSPFLLVTPGTYAPGNEELAAIQTRYNDVTLEKLKEGHAIYTAGACINCHGAQSIYKYGEKQWEHIIDEMALKADITDKEKDAVYKYVLAMKATQPKETK